MGWRRFYRLHLTCHHGQADLLFGLPVKDEAPGVTGGQHYPDGEWYGLRDAMMDSWLNFAKTGNPANALLPQWPAYTLTERSYMQFAASSSVGRAPWPAEVTALLGR